MDETLVNCWCGGKAHWKTGNSTLTPVCSKCGKEGKTVPFRDWRLSRNAWNSSNARGTK